MSASNARAGTKNANPDLDADTTPAALLARISTLESQLRTRTAELEALTSKSSSNPPPSPNARRSSVLRNTKTKKPAKPFDPSLYSTRFIALKFSYLGGRYNGYEHANGDSAPPKPTVEEVLWKALRKARLISPSLADGCDDSMEVVWSAEMRAWLYGGGGGGPNEQILDGRKTHNGNGSTGKVRLELNWDGCQYSKCGRTDRGVSAFGQVVGIRVRSNRPRTKKEKYQNGGHRTTNGPEETMTPTEDAAERTVGGDEMPGLGNGDLSTDVDEPPFDPIGDELPYMAILNSILPPDIRILAWCPDPPPDFDARFSCRERRYKYFFTNPAFCPNPGPQGLHYANGQPADVREGWLDVQRMSQAARKLEGLHDFRNLCKIDASKQMPSCERRITFADVEEWDSTGVDLTKDPRLNIGGGLALDSAVKFLPGADSPTKRGPKVYTFSVHGSAFLWHQVRCMVAILFLVGQGLEDPAVVDQFLNIKKNPGRPMYEMADDAPLVLWDCIFPNEESNGADALGWIYAGDKETMTSIKTKSDGKFGTGGVVDELWSQWRKAKIDETLTASLLDLALRQGDGSALERGGYRETSGSQIRSQKIFDGGDAGRAVGEYVPVMEKLKMDSLDEQNAKYAAGKLARREAKKSQAVQ